MQLAKTLTIYIDDIFNLLFVFPIQDEVYEEAS